MNKPLRKSPRDTSTEKKLELLFEIGCEEIPSGMLARAEEEFKVNLEKLLATENLIENVSVETFSGPRRLTAYAKGFPVKQADVVVLIGSEVS